MPEADQDVWFQIGVQEGLRRYSQIRKRLRNPPNAVRDEGIDLKRKPTSQLSPQPEPQTRTRSDILSQRISAILALYPPIEHKLTIGVIFRSTATAFDITPEQIRSRSRRPIYAFPRQAGMYLTRKLLKTSYPIIAAKFGMDHTTVIHACKRVESRVLVDPNYATKINDIEMDLVRRYCR